MSEIVKESWKKYLTALQLHPLRTKAITAGVLVGCSDVIAQKISGVKRLQFRRLLLLMNVVQRSCSSLNQSSRFEPGNGKILGREYFRALRMKKSLLYGLAYSGPFGHFLHKLMDVIFQGKKGNKTVAKKVLLEQLTASPWNNFLFMMYYGLVVEGRPWNLVKNKVRKDYPSIQLTAWKFWPIVGWINYQYMPLQFRVPSHSFVASCWAIFLNLKARSITAKKA